MNWTREAPKVLGFYWVLLRDGAGITMAEVRHEDIVRSSPFIQAIGSHDFWPASEFVAWYGPVAPPEVPEEFRGEAK